MWGKFLIVDINGKLYSASIYIHNYFHHGTHYIFLNTIAEEALHLSFSKTLWLGPHLS